MELQKGVEAMDRKEKEKLLNSPEYQFLRTEPDLKEGIFLLGFSGSYAYGTNVPGSDIDLRGIAYNTKETILGLHEFDHIVNTDTDTTVYSLQKAVVLLADCNPSMLDMLGLREEDYFILDDTGRELLDNQDMFYSKRAQVAFGGYATAQLRRLQNALAHDAYPEAEKQQHILGTLQTMLQNFNKRYQEQYGIKVYLKDGELVTDMAMTGYPLRQAHGMLSEMVSVIREYEKLNHRNRKKDDKHLNKHAMHLVRLLCTGTELLETGKMHAYREREHELLMDIRNGKFQNSDHTFKSEFFDLVSEWEKNFQYAAMNTDLPDKPDMKRVEEFVMKVNKKTVTR